MLKSAQESRTRVSTGDPRPLGLRFMSASNLFYALSLSPNNVGDIESV